MLAGAVVYIALIALVATTILSAGFAMTRATIARMAQPYLAAGYQRAAASLQTALVAELQSGGAPHALPSFTPLPAACANAGCTYTTTERIAVASSDATPGPVCDDSQPNCAPNVQTNAYVTEGRVAVVITVNVNDASGALVATRSATVLVRTFNTPPYAAIAGARNAAFDDVANAHAAGDDGGAPAATANPCASTPPGTAADTTVRVAYRNAATNACTNGSSWADSSYSSE